MYGPQHPFAQRLHTDKYRMEGETFEQAMSRLASTLATSVRHEARLLDILLNQRFCWAGRVQAAIGSERQVTPYNCFVAPTISDSLIEGEDSIMEVLTKAATTLRLGGGVGYDFSTLRPYGAIIQKLKSSASGPLSYMDMYDAMCKTIASAGHRRGAQMGVLRVDHPDIEAFIEAKQNDHRLRNFNISVGVTNEFMMRMKAGADFALCFGGQEVRRIDAQALWDRIMRATWDWAEPGVLFLDTINRENNLWYCETIAATNPCGEQPLPPNGACLLGSFNLTRYLKQPSPDRWDLDIEQLLNDVPAVVEATDRIIDLALYPLTAQYKEAQSKRRMGLGLMGVANAIEAMGHEYGSDNFCRMLRATTEAVTEVAYDVSCYLAAIHKPFPLYDSKLLESGFAKRLSKPLRAKISRYGLRNSHLISIAPTGTISMTCDNISSGIEPVFSLQQKRRVNMPAGEIEIEWNDYGLQHLGVRGKTSESVTIDEHLSVLGAVVPHVDSAVSKTCNIGSSVTFEQFSRVYERAWEMGAKGCTTYRSGGKRAGVLQSSPSVDGNSEGMCRIDPTTGVRSCEV